MEDAGGDITVAGVADLCNYVVGRPLADFLGAIAQCKRYRQDIDFRLTVREIDIHQQNAGIALKIGQRNCVSDARRFNPARLAAEPSAMGQVPSEGTFEPRARITIE